MLPGTTRSSTKMTTEIPNRVTSIRSKAPHEIGKHPASPPSAMIPVIALVALPPVARYSVRAYLSIQTSS